MNKFFINCLFLLYMFSSMMILGWAMIFPFGIGMKDFPTWTGWIAYPLTLIICASQSQIFKFFDKKDVL